MNRYGGHYVPTLANVIYEENQQQGNAKINIKGVIVGNGLTDNQIDLNSFMDVYGYHNLIPYSFYQNIVSVCDGNYLTTTNPECNNIVNQVISKSDIMIYMVF